MSLAELTDWLLAVARQGLGAKIHCTGNGSVQMTLDATAVLREQRSAPARSPVIILSLSGVTKNPWCVGTLVIERIDPTKQPTRSHPHLRSQKRLLPGPDC